MLACTLHIGMQKISEARMKNVRRRVQMLGVAKTILDGEHKFPATALGKALKGAVH